MIREDTTDYSSRENCFIKKRKRKRKEVIYMLKSKSLKKSKVIVLLFERKKVWYLFRENKGY
jgi:hypothetical protein